MKPIGTIIYVIFSVLIAILAYHVNIIDGSHWPLFWSTVDFFFPLLVLIKWLVLHQITWPIIKETFNWFF